VGNAIYRQFRFQPAIDIIQRGLRYGAICPILDGFDELCGTVPSLFSADDTIAGLINTLEGVEGSRILLTCRESFWHDNVDVTLQSQVTAFRISPFSEGQRSEYLTKRFPDDVGRPKKERTLSLLQRIGQLHRPPAAGQQIVAHQNLSYLPWVVQFAAEAADTPVTELAGSSEAPRSVDPLGEVLFQFCRREQQRIGISITPENQIKFFGSLAAVCDEWFSVDQVDDIHGLLSEDA
jgi:hypothetical protein